VTPVELAAFATITLVSAALYLLGRWAIHSMERHHVPTPPRDPGPAPDGGHVLRIVTEHDARAVREVSDSVARSLERVA
jgi:hypothetical protein